MAYTTIDDPSAYFKVQLFTGTGSSNAVTFNDTDTDMQPDLVWIKSRDDTNEHYISDSVRGTGKEIYSSLSNAEVSDANGVTAFGSDGFTVGSGTGLNGSSDSNVAWCWKESATAGFDIVSYTGNGSARTISHSLSAVPKFIMVKNRESSENWRCYHVSNGNTHEIYLDLTNAKVDTDTAWNDTTPTSSVFSVGTNHGVNKDTEGLIAYLFAEKQGFSKFGSYTGNGNADGAFVYLGFRPALVIAKRTDSTANWYMMTAKRSDSGGGNPLDRPLFANENQAENDGDNNVDLLSNGFKIRGSGTAQNGSGATYIYMAFAEAPFVNSNGVPCNAR